MRVWTSWMAASMSRLSSNSSLMFAVLWRQMLDIWTSPSTWMTADSIGSTTADSITSGAAPGSESWMVTTGRSMSGYWLTPSRVNAIPPKTISAIISIHAKTGRLIEIEARLMLLVRSLRGAGGRRRRRRRGLHDDLGAVGDRRRPRHDQRLPGRQPFEDFDDSFP